MYKGFYRVAAAEFLLTALYVPLEWYTLSWLTGDWDLANTRVWLLWLILGMAAHDAWDSAVAVQTWDQVTLWDGAVLKGVDSWTGYVVVRKWYTAATSA